MKRLLAIATILSISISPALAAPVVEWQSRFGALEQDWANSVVPLSGGGYLAAGTYLVQPGNPILGGSEEFTLARTDAAGNLLWQRMYNLGAMSWGANAVEAADGGFVMLGTVRVQYNYFDSHAALMKTDRDGNLLWTRNYTANQRYRSDNTYGQHLQRTADGGFIILATYIEYSGADSTILLIRTDADGNELWRTRPGDALSGGSQVRPTTDGGFAVCGSVSTDENAYDSYDMYLLKTDAAGMREWSVSGGTAVYDACGSFRQTADGGYVLFGYTTTFGVENTTDYVLQKYDASGNHQWRTIWGDSGDEWSGGVAEIDGGGFLISGTRRSTDIANASEQLELTQISAGGRKLSSIFLGEPSWSGLPYAEGASIEKTADGGFVVGGMMVAENWDVFLAKIAQLETGSLVNVTIDIKPGSDTNPVNLRSKGTTPVAILGAADFDASRVDPATVTLAGAPVATNGGGKPQASATDVNGDGTIDLLVHVATAQMTLSAGDSSAALAGMTLDGIPIEGIDRVTVIK